MRRARGRSCVTSSASTRTGDQRDHGRARRCRGDGAAGARTDRGRRAPVAAVTSRSAPALRCPWAEGSDLLGAYHDDEWGVPSRDDTHLFEMLVLEGAQAGLSWSTILNKRENYRRALDGFDPDEVARYDDRKLAALLEDPGIVRNRLKVRSTVTNARAVLAARDEHGTFASYLWSFVDDRPVVNQP